MAMPAAMDIEEALNRFDPSTGETGRFQQTETSVKCQDRTTLFRAIKALPDEALEWADFEGGDKYGYTLRVKVQELD